MADCSANDTTLALELHGTNMRLDGRPKHSDQIDVLSEHNEQIDRPLEQDAQTESSSEHSYQADSTLKHKDQMALVQSESQIESRSPEHNDQIDQPSQHEDQGDDQRVERASLLTLPIELMLMVRKHFSGLELELLARCCRRFWYSRSAAEQAQSRRYFHDDQCARYLLATYLKLDRIRRCIDAASRERVNSEQLICRRCWESHPRALFTLSDQAKPARERACIGSTGYFRFCDHVNLNHEAVKRFALRGSDEELQACSRCTTYSWEPAVRAMISDSTRRPMWHASDIDTLRTRMLVHVWTKPLAASENLGFRPDLRPKLINMLQDDVTPVCNHHRVYDVIDLLGDDHFHGDCAPTPVRCLSPGCFTEVCIIRNISTKHRANGNERGVFELEVKRCLGTGTNPTEPEWLNAIADDETKLAKPLEEEPDEDIGFGPFP